MSRNESPLLNVMTELNGRLYGVARKSGLDVEDAKDIVQEVMLSVLEQMDNNPKLQNDFEKDINYFKNYLFRTLFNKIIDFKKSNKKGITEAPPNKRSNDPNLKPGQQPIIFIPLEKNPSLPDFQDPVQKQQRDETLKKVLQEFKEKALSDQERSFLELFLELADLSEGINISEIARLMGIAPDQGHNIWKRIRRKFNDFNAKDGRLENVADGAAILDIGIGSLVKDIISPSEELDEEYLSAGREITNNVFAKLGVDAFIKFSRILK